MSEEQCTAQLLPRAFFIVARCDKLLYVNEDYFLLFFLCSKRKSDEVSEVARKKIKVRRTYTPFILQFTYIHVILKEEHDVEGTGLTSLTGFGSLT